MCHSMRLKKPHEEGYIYQSKRVWYQIPKQFQETLPFLRPGGLRLKSVVVVGLLPGVSIARWFKAFVMDTRSAVLFADHTEDALCRPNLIPVHWLASILWAWCKLPGLLSRNSGVATELFLPTPSWSLPLIMLPLRGLGLPFWAGCSWWEGLESGFVRSWNKHKVYFGIKP